MKHLMISVMSLFLLSTCAFSQTVQQCANRVRGLNPRGVKSCLNKVPAKGTKKVPDLKARVQALHDMNKLFDEFQPYDDGNVYISSRSVELSEKLAQLTQQDPYKTMSYLRNNGKVMGFGPEASALRNWLDYYKSNYPAKKRDALYEVLREYDALKKYKMPCSEGTLADVVTSDYLKARQVDLKDMRAVKTFQNDAKEIWDKYTLKERNDLIYAVLDRNVRQCAAQGSDFADIKSSALFDKDTLDHIDTLKNADMSKPETFQGKLGAFFDGLKTPGGSTGNSSFLSWGDIGAINSKLQEGLPTMVDGTLFGAEIAEFYKTNDLKISIASMKNSYSEYDPESKTIKISSQLVDDYIRNNARTSDRLLSDEEEMKKLTAYLSPAFIYAATQHMRAEGVDVPKDVKDMDAAAMQALFVAEKSNTDQNFAKLFERSQMHSPYAHQMMQSGNDLSQDTASYLTQSQDVVLREFSATNTRYGAENRKWAEKHVAQIMQTNNLLNKVRQQFGSVRISSGIRCDKVNRAVGGSSGSQHKTGEAVDFSPTSGADRWEIYVWIINNLKFGQVIYEAKGSSRWIHLSTGTKQQAQLYRNGRYSTYRKGMAKPF